MAMSSSFFLRHSDGTVTTRSLNDNLNEEFGDNDSFHLTMNGTPLEFKDIVADSIVDVNIDLLGGGKKRKKKNYTKPKKTKRKPKKVKMSVLKFYKVDGDKIQRLRKSCPSCGAGVNMGKHKDRFYCGKCTLTYVFTKDD